MLIRRCQYASEAILISMVCAAPWAFGAVEAWAEFVLFFGIFLLTLLSLVIRTGQEGTRALFCVPSLAIAGLVLLGAFQATPLPSGLLKTLSPAAKALRADLAPAEPTRVAGDEGQPVSVPAATISLEPETTLRAVVRLAAGWALFQAVLSLGLGTAPLRRFSIALVVNSALLTLFALVQMLSWNGKVYWIREAPSGFSSGPFVNHNHLAAYLNLGLVFALSYLLAPRRDLQSGYRSNGNQAWTIYLCGLLIVGVVASLARTAFVVMAVSSGLLVMSLRPQRKRLILVLGSLVALILVLLLFLGPESGYKERIASLLESEHYLLRSEIWRTAGRLIPAYPIWGTGFGTFSIATLRLFQDNGASVYEHAENEYVEWLLEGGLIGLGLVLLALAGTIYLGLRAASKPQNRSDKGLIIAALVGVLGLSIQSLGDFALHVPAVSIVGVSLAAFLAKLGLEWRTDEPRSTTNPTSNVPALPLWRRGLSVAGACVVLAASAFSLSQGMRSMRIETLFSTAGFYLPGNVMPASGAAGDSMDELERKLDLLEQAVPLSPNRADSHWRVGLLYLQLYSTSTEESIRDIETDEAKRAQQSSPLWLFGSIHNPPDGKPLTTDELLEIDHIRLYLVPAARAFLQARRCSPLMADPHARLAMLDYLLQGNDPSVMECERALRLAGTNSQVLDLVQGVALQLPDLDLLTRAWNRILRLEQTDLPTIEAIADIASQIFTPEIIRDRVAQSALTTLQFAERLYQAPEQKAARDLLIQAARERLREDDTLSPAEIKEAESRVSFLLGDLKQAEADLTAAIALNPSKSAWRLRLINWYIDWKRPREAYDQSVVGLYYTPGNLEMVAARERAAQEIAKTE